MAQVEPVGVKTIRRSVRFASHRLDMLGTPATRTIYRAPLILSHWSLIACEISCARALIASQSGGGAGGPPVATGAGSARVTAAMRLRNRASNLSGCHRRADCLNASLRRCVMGGTTEEAG